MTRSLSPRFAVVCAVLALLFSAFPSDAAIRAAGPDAATFEASFEAAADSPIELRAARQRLTLRPAANRGVAVERSATRTALTERLVVSDAKAARSIIYDLASRDGVATAVADGRALRFLGPNRGEASLVLSAPVVIDAAGKPSHRASWEVARDRNGRPTSLRLRIDDPFLEYPISVRYTADAKTATARIPRATPLQRADRVASLADTGSISGTLYDDVTGQVIPHELVHAYDANSVWIASGVSDLSGRYTIRDLPPGPYYVLAVPYEYDSELYNERACPDRSCLITSGDAVVVTADVEVTGIDFTLTSLFGRISGTVTDASNDAPLGGIGVVVYSSDGSAIGSAFSDYGSGGYTATVPSAGNYYARTFNYFYEGYVDQLWSGVDCTGCDVLSGTPISVAVSANVDGIDFALDPDGGRISGRVVDAGSGAGIAFELVTVANTVGGGVTFGYTDELGNYTSFNGLATGNYYVYSQPYGYDGEIYDNVVCAGACDPNFDAGTAVAVTKGSTTSDINFSLAGNLTRISGRVTAQATGNGLESIEVGVYDTEGSPVASAYTDSTGTYQVSLPGGGTYYARTHSASSVGGYLDELYDNIPCVTCSVLQGTAINVSGGALVTGIDFALASGGRISGRLTDDALVPIANASVLIYDASGLQQTFGQTNANGDYTSHAGLPTGSYRAVAAPFGYAGELYNNIACPAGECVIANGTAISVTVGTTTANINFALTSNIGRVRGTVTDDETMAPLPGIEVSLYDSAGQWAGTGVTDESGLYEVTLTEAGTYYARTFNGSGIYADELYDNIVCNNCNVTTGTALQVTIGGVISNVNFALESIACPFITVDPATLPGGTVGDAYSTTVAAAGGEAPYTLELAEGSLPPGLAFNASTGEISGTFTTPGNFAFQILATDANNCVGGRSYVVDVTDGVPTIDSVSPSAGPSTGGQTVTITGTNLSTVTSVTFNGASSVIQVATPTTIEVRTPPHALGTVDVTVTTSGGSATAPDAYTFEVPTTPVTLTSSLNPSTYGDSVTFTAMVNDQTAEGTVSFFDGGTLLATVTVNIGEAIYTTSTLTAGSHPMTARFNGNADYAPSTSNVVVQHVSKKARTISMTAAPASSTYGDSVSLTATVSPAEEATSIDFYDGATLLGSAPVVGGVATLTTTVLTAGTHSLTAAIAETENYLAATSASVSYLVAKAPRSITLTVAPSPSVYGNAITLTATLTPGAEATSVEFREGASVLGTSAVSGGVATFTTATLNAGAYNFSAATAATANYLAATSNSVAHTIEKATPVFSALSAPTVIVGTASTTVSGTISTGALVPTGSVTITVNSVIYTATIGAGGAFSATVSTATLVVGAYPIQFSYAGDANFHPASATSVLSVVYNFSAVKEPPPANEPSTIPIRIKILNASGTNVSAASLTVTAYGVRAANSSTWVPAEQSGGGSNPDLEFDFQNAGGGSYKFNLKTTGLAPGNYFFGFTVEGEPAGVIHEFAFTVQ